MAEHPATSETPDASPRETVTVAQIAERFRAHAERGEAVVDEMAELRVPDGDADLVARALAAARAWSARRP
ncbi:hypothetical protein [Cellulomonas sp. HD19AZ1]|uniref:hypothetical protein n=1 Tax=Cellulomonas sp. HD19AZ1 TaxID=2559593 RepID=UPI00107109C7|nr:hypothetical protein [Cellulomonas sp. HD19AZ1]TFH68131.1 hypothetical protein E4A51_17965 [Cellulomonas sp. HD19AZ1]